MCGVTFPDDCRNHCSNFYFLSSICVESSFLYWWTQIWLKFLCVSKGSHLVSIPCPGSSESGDGGCGVSHAWSPTASLPIWVGFKPKMSVKNFQFSCITRACPFIGIKILRTINLWVCKSGGGEALLITSSSMRCTPCSYAKDEMCWLPPGLTLQLSCRAEAACSAHHVALEHRQERSHEQSRSAYPSSGRDPRGCRISCWVWADLEYTFAFQCPDCVRGVFHSLIRVPISMNMDSACCFLLFVWVSSLLGFLRNENRRN